MGLEFYVNLAWVLIALIPTVIMFKFLEGKVSTTSRVILSFLHFYVFVVLIFTVFARSYNGSLRYQFDMFSYMRQLLLHPMANISDVIINLFMLMPIGILMPRVSNYKKTLLCGVLLTVVIEFMQLITMRGYFQISDMFFNALGVLFGCGIYSLLSDTYYFKKHRRHRHCHRHKHNHSHGHHH